ncbi:DUF349 domain-containing protein [Marinobacter arenosus]|uniref:DUF349 domain-containing protein n=1 Tax=Marinobacter arenosus TaxID=2856822 RepID=UPI001C4A93CC|nr:DUF349 domain-containing protein [Marinobacter arenosus]MBW0149047.1 DUF349 domain-containing protein [Marinobacter arenosus]
MAAFIQKLFKSRKSPEPTGKARNEAPAAQQEDTRASLRDTQLETLKGAPEQSRLAELAIEGVTADIRLEAAGRLTETENLQHVQKKAKGRDKTVYQTVRQALQKLREEQARLDSLSQTITTLINHAKDQARSDDTKLYEARLGALTRQWAEVESHANAEQAQSFLEAIHRCKERLEAIQSAQADEERQKEQRLQREETLALLSNTLDDLKAQAPDTLPSVASLDALQKTQENRWLEATRDTSVDKQQQKAYEANMLSLRNYISAVRRAAQEKDTLAELAADGASGDDHANEGREKAKALLREINWPDGFPMPALMEPVRQLAGKPAPSQPARTEDLEKQKTTAAELEKTLASLEAALEAKQLKESRQLLKTAQQQFKSLDRRHGKPFQARLQLLNGQLRELSDWLGFATEPKQIELCEQMEYLADQPMEPEAKAERIKELQNEWRNLGGSSDRSLWTRFKAASDKAYEPCKDYFSAKSGLKRANLEKRKAICAELENFLTHADWSTMDWKAAEKIHLTARQEWKAAWPVEFRENRQVQKQFDDLLKKLEAPLDEERQKNEALKQEIVDKANALIDHEPLQEAMNQAKNLQADWKVIGITRHREDRKLWQAFRKACDQIFGRRDAQRNEQQQAAQAADDAATPVLGEIETLTSADDGATLAGALTRLNDLSVSALSPVLKDKVQSEKRRLKQALTDQQLRANVSAWQSLVMARTDGPSDEAQVPDHWPALAAGQDPLDHGELVIRAEILAGVTSPDADQQRRMEIQVQRLAEGMGSSEQASNGIQELEKLVACWCLLASDSAPDQALAQRLNNALAALVPA